MNSRDRARQWIQDNGTEDSLTFEFEEHAAEARAELSNRVRRHLEVIDERECSLKAWNAICDALGELE